MTSKTVQRAVVVGAAAIFMYFGGSSKVLADPPICEEVCTSSTDCTDECYVDMMEFENGHSISCLEYGTFDADTCCGDGFCATDYEDAGSCAADCDLNVPATPTCGDSSCDTGESHRNCPTDCPRFNSCGDGICDGPDTIGPGETANNCPEDCLYADFCELTSPTGWQCDGYYTCRGGRCTYDPGVSTCWSDGSCAVGQKCIATTKVTPGVCVSAF